MVTLVLEELAKCVAGEDHLRELDLRLEPGSFHVLLGPTAAGKTTDELAEVVMSQRYAAFFSLRRHSGQRLG